MKKSKLLALLSVLMLAAMLFSACGARNVAKIPSFEKVLNKDYAYAETVAESVEALTEVEGYAVTGKTSEFVLFEKDGGAIEKIFSFRSNSVVMTASNVDGAMFTVELSEEPMFVVTKTKNGEASYIAYDATGAEILTTSHKPNLPSAYADMTRYAGALYEADDAGKLTKVTDIPEHLELDVPTLWNEDYFYFLTETGVQIFDRDFTFVSAWYAPTAAEGLNGFPLNNGDMFLQYTVALDPYAEEYDFYEIEEGVTTKYDLVTKVMTAKNGNTKEIKMDYVLNEGMSVYHLNYILENLGQMDGMIAKGLENIADVYPIVDKKVDRSVAAADIVMIENSGKIKASAKIVDGQIAELPLLVGEDLYLVKTVYGRALTNDKGKVRTMINNDEMEIVGEYIVGEKAIYDLSMNKVYDLIENKATVLTTIDNTVFVMKGDKIDVEYEVIAFCDGEQKTVSSFKAVGDSQVFFEIEGADCYAVLETSSGTYTYYNAAGKELRKTTTLLTAAASSYLYDGVVLAGVDGDKTVFFLLDK